MFKTGFKPNTELWKKLSTAPLKQNEANNHIYVSSIFSLQQLKQREKKNRNLFVWGCVLWEVAGSNCCCCRLLSSSTPAPKLDVLGFA